MAIMLCFVSQIQNILSIRLTHSENIELTSFKLRLECLADGNPAPTYRFQTFKTQISLFSLKKKIVFLIKLDFRWFKDDDTTTVRCHTIIIMVVVVTIMKIVMNMMVPPIGDQVIK